MIRQRFVAGSNPCPVGNMGEPASLPSTGLPEALFGVERSLTTRFWRGRTADEALVGEHRRRLGLPDIAARLLAARGVTAEDGANFLAPTMRHFFPDPSRFAGVSEAAEVLEEAIVSGRPTAVFADYDVDGGTAAAQLVRYFRARSRELTIYVPDRMTEGYGPSPRAFERLKAQGIELVVTVDCGAASYDALVAAAALRLDVVVIDHHLMAGPPPEALAVVNPNRLDCQSAHGSLTAAGVVLIVLAAVNREARKRGSLGSNALPDLMANLDLSALGTVCDVAPLTGLNRAIVAQGLKVLARGENIGLKALAAVARREKVGSVYDLGFVLGPRLNAGGRIGDSSLATRLLSTEDPVEAEALAIQLDALNVERRTIEDEILKDAVLRAERDCGGRMVVVVGDPAWHPGVIGIAAGRLKERLLKPVIVLGGGGAEEPAKGSGRSISGVNLGRAIAAAAQAGVLRAGGGHAMAAGLTVDWDKAPALLDFLEHHLSEEIRGSSRETHTLWVDATASIAGANLELLSALDSVGPFGAGHPEPVFGLPDMQITFSSLAKGEHVRFVAQDARGERIRGIAFRAQEAIAQALQQKERLLHLAVKLKRNDFGGNERVEAELIDAAWAR